MRDTPKTEPHDARRDTTGAPRNRGSRNWLIIGALVVLALIIVFWLTALPDVAERTDVAPSTDVPAEQVIADPNPDAVTIEGNDVDAVTETAPLPVEDADPNAVVPQNALIPPAPIDEAPRQ